MAKVIPHTMLMWVQSNERHQEVVVHVETVPSVPALGDRLWSDKLNRYGKVTSVNETTTFVTVE